MDYHFQRQLSHRKCKGVRIGEVRALLRWQSVVKCIHMVGLVNFLSGLPSFLTLTSLFCPLPEMMEKGNLKGDCVYV